MISFSEFFAFFQTKIFHDIINLIVQIFITTSPLILAIVLFLMFWPLWINYTRSLNILNTKYVVLEIRLPKEINKSPMAMEVFFNSLHNSSDGDWFAKYWKGERRPIYSMELISIEGVVKFMIRAEEKRKTGVMTTLYSQFPGIEIVEIEDYTKGIHFDPKETKVWGAEFEFTQKDPYPIKTYIDYGLIKDPKEEYKIDPLLPMIEFLGNLGSNQQLWVQFVIKAHGKDKVKKGHLIKKTDAWKDEAAELVNKILIRDKETKVSGIKDEKSGFTKLPTISEGEKVVVDAIERSIAKASFDVGIRVVCISKKELFDRAVIIGGIVSSFRQFNAENLNGFKPNTSKWSFKVKGNPWSDYKNMRANKQSRLVLEAYKRRCFFDEPFKSDKNLVMTIEELATVYHFPGEVAITPTLNRIPSKKNQAPANLPI